MRRRDWVKAAAVAAALPVPPPRRRRSGDTWTFALDSRCRWSLASPGGEAVVAGGEIAVELADARPVPLRELEGLRRLRFGGGGQPAGWQVTGTAAGVEVTARFVDGRPAGTALAPHETAWPRVAVGVRGLDAARTLVAVHFLDTAAARVPALEGAAAPPLLVNGYQSWSPCRVARAGGPDELTGWWQLATLGGRTGVRAQRRAGAASARLGLAFGSDDGGDGQFVVGPAGVRALSRLGRRMVGASYPPATAALTILPTDDPLLALGALAALGRDGPLPTEVPTGWCSWYELYGAVTEADVLASLEAARRSFDPRDFQVIQVDDGFQRAVGDWDPNDKFPHGHRWLTDRIHEAGFRAGLWMAPFAVAERSGIPAARPEWLLCDEQGAPLVLATREDWGGRIHGLDASRREVQEHLRDLVRHATRDWGYDYLKLDFLHYGALGTRSDRWQSGAEACRAGLRAMREGAGGAFLLGCGAPLQQALGVFDGMRVGEDVDATWEGIQPAATAALRRAYLDRRAWMDDPDALVVREPLSLEEARAWVSVVALTGQMALASDRLDRLPPERLALVQRAMPVARVAGRAADLDTADRVTAPSLRAGGTSVAPLGGPWRFRPGDDAGWADPALDDAAWDTITAGTPWEEAGHPGLDGFAWYRTRFTAPRVPSPGPLVLELGRVDDADETYLNGRLVGTTGAFPPRYASAWQAYRRYAIPRRLVRWGAENLVAVRVYDGGGPGGLYSFRRDRPPSWVVAAVRDGWWMLAAVNWDEEPRRMGTDLAALGMAGPLAVYDVWRDARAADVDGRWSGLVAPHSATVLALRRRARRPFVIGSTRHVVQGAVDLAREEWDARARVLRGTSVGLDARAYAVTIALPAGFTARACRADVECLTETGVQADGRAGARGDRGAGDAAPPSLRLVFPAPRREISWEVSF